MSKILRGFKIRHTLLKTDLSLLPIFFGNISQKRSGFFQNLNFGNTFLP